MACHEDSCFIDGIEYKHGSTVPIDCNSCLCSNGKLSGCTLKGCFGYEVITKEYVLSHDRTGPYLVVKM